MGPSKATIKKSTITGNTAMSGPGGGISMPTGFVAVPRLMIHDSTISNNTAEVGGGLQVGDDSNGATTSQSGSW